MKELVDKIIEDLGNDKPIKGILLKAQIVASKLGHEKFEEWIFNEQNGYSNWKDIPDYRIVGAKCKTVIATKFGEIMRPQTIPVGVFQNKDIEFNMTHSFISNSLTELENTYCGNEKGWASRDLPAIAYTQVQKLYPEGRVYKVWQEFPATSLIGVIDVFKSRLLQFFLDLNKEIHAGIDFTKIEGKEAVSNIINNKYQINAAVANLGSGTVNTGEISKNTIGQNISNPEIQKELLNLIFQLEQVSKNTDNDDLKFAVDNLKKECKKNSWSKNALRLCFNALSGIATGVIANQISPIVSKALEIL